MSARASPAWLAQRERGSELLMALAVRIVLACGRPVGEVLLYPVCAYFLLFSRAARRASFDYLRRALGRTPTWRDRLRHYHVFAATLLDRVFLAAGRVDALDCRSEGLDAVRAHVAAGRGCLLFGAHFGSFEMLRAIGRAECPVPVHVLMHDTHAPKMARVLQTLDPRASSGIISLGRPQAMLDAREALRRGELVALLADRSMRGERLVACEFLGAEAPFPRGPFDLAALLDAPIVLFCAVHCGRGRYAVRFDALEEAAPAEREAATQRQCRAFASWLESRCRAAPYNWFNFYDFWAPPNGATPP